MVELTRSEQIRADTLATMQIANEMVHVLASNLQATIDQKDQEILRLRRRLAVLEAQLDESHSLQPAPSCQ